MIEERATKSSAGSKKGAATHRDEERARGQSKRKRKGFESTQDIVLWWQICPNITVVTHANAFVEALNHREIPLFATPTIVEMRQVGFLSFHHPHPFVELHR